MKIARTAEGRPRAAWISDAEGILLLAGSALLVLAQLHTVFWDYVVVPKLLVFRVVTALLLAALAVTFAVGGRGTRRPSRLGAVAALLFLWLAVTSAASDIPAVSLLGEAFRYEGVAAYVGYLAFFFAGRRHVTFETLIRPKVAAVIVGAASVVSVLALAQQVWPVGHEVPLLALVSSARSTSTFSNPLFLGLFGCLLLPLLLGYVLMAVPPVNRTVVALACAGLCASVFFTYSRGAWLGLAFALAVGLGFVFSNARRQWKSLALCLIVALVVVVGARGGRAAIVGGDAVVDPASRVVEVATGGGTATMRLEMYKGALELVLERPLLGRGFGTYVVEASRVRTERMVRIEGPNSYPDRPHNAQLYLAYAAGIPGLALYMVLVVGSLVTLSATTVRARGDRRVIGAVVLSGCVAYLVSEATSFSVIEVTPLFWALLGSAAGNLGAASTWAHSPGPSASARRRFVLFAPQPQVGLLRAAAYILPPVLIACGAVLVYHGARVAQADHLHNSVLVDLRGTSGAEGLVERERRAVGLWPYVASYWHTLADLQRTGVDPAFGPPSLDAARTTLLEGLDHLPSDAELSVTLSDVEIERGKPLEAVMVLEALLLVNPFLEDAHFNLGLARLMLGEPDRAVRAFETAVGLVPSDAEAFLQLSRAYAALGDAEAAARADERARALDPSMRQDD